MNLEKIIQLITKNSDINIQYSNINGKEKLIINGEEIKEEDTSIKEEIEEYLIEIGEKKLLGVFNAKRTIMNKIDGIYDFLNKMKELGYIVSYKDKGQTIIVKTN